MARDCTEFRVTSFGGDAAIAFSAAQREVHFERGPGDYPGTIAAKPGWTLLDLPARTSSEKFLGWVRDVTNLAVWYSDRDSAAELSDRDLCTTLSLGDELYFAVEKIPPLHRPQVDHAARIYNDEHGPALALALTPGETRHEKERAGIKGARGVRAFVFAGAASK